MPGPSSNRPCDLSALLFRVEKSKELAAFPRQLGSGRSVPPSVYLRSPFW